MDWDLRSTWACRVAPPTGAAHELPHSLRALSTIAACKLPVGHRGDIHVQIYPV